METIESSDFSDKIHAAINLTKMRLERSSKATLFQYSTDIP